MDLNEHPCFNDIIRYKVARVHLPVAPRCNIQCNYCSRNFSCVNESRPGVTTSILTPEQAIIYLDEVIKRIPSTKVVGIAGPGDPFANPDETLSTLKIVREKYPDIILCVATNGLNILPYIPFLKELKVSHVTITINAMTEETAMKIYSWYRVDKRVIAGREGAKILLGRQLEAIKNLKAEGIIVKINTVVVAGVNESETILIANKVKQLGADILNCIPMYKTKNSNFKHLEPPSTDVMSNIRQKVASIITQMTHCGRCRADAAGIIGRDNRGIMRGALSVAIREEKKQNIETKNRPYVAIASRDGIFINLHLGEATELIIVGRDSNGKITFIDKRTTPRAGDGELRWKKLGEILYDVSALLVASAGKSPVLTLKEYGIEVFIVEGLINEVVDAYFSCELSKFKIIKRHDCDNKEKGCDSSVSC